MFNFILLAAIFSFIGSPLSAEQIRAAFDMGSGQTKMTVAVVDEKSGRPVQILYSEETVVLLGHDFKQSKDGKLSAEILAKAEAILVRYQNIALALGAKEMAGVATAVFRESQNGTAFIEKIRCDTGINLQLISQIEEGKLGFLTAVAASNKPVDKVIAWDSGGASFQITVSDGEGLAVYEGPWGSSKALAALITQIQGHDFTQIQTANPVMIEEASSLREIIQTSLKEASPELQAKLDNPEVEVVAFGGTFSAFNKAAIAIGVDRYTKEQVWTAIEGLVGSSDRDLERFFEPEMVLSSLILVYSVMDHFNIREVHYKPTIGSTLGIFLSPSFWASTGVLQ